MSTPLTMRNRHLLALLGTCYMLAVSALQNELLRKNRAMPLVTLCGLVFGSVRLRVDVHDRPVDAVPI